MCDLSIRPPCSAIFFLFLFGVEFLEALRAFFFRNEIEGEGKGEGRRRKFFFTDKIIHSSLPPSLRLEAHTHKKRTQSVSLNNRLLLSLFFAVVLLRGCWMQGTDKCEADGEAEVCTCTQDLCNAAAATFAHARWRRWATKVTTATATATALLLSTRLMTQWMTAVT